ncbi:MAG: 1-deoxy-D-xylulose-5-phosphate synthase, partial [Terrimesophilobacter sp.]
RLRQDLRDAGVDTAVTELGLPDEFLPHGSRAEILEIAGLTAKKISRDVVDQVLGNRIPVARPLPADSDAPSHPWLRDAADRRGVEGRPEHPL